MTPPRVRAGGPRPRGCSRLLIDEVLGVFVDQHPEDCVGNKANLGRIIIISLYVSLSHLLVSVPDFPPLPLHVENLQVFPLHHLQLPLVGSFPGEGDQSYGCSRLREEGLYKIISCATF